METTLNWSFYLEAVAPDAETCSFLDYFLHYLFRLKQNSGPNILHFDGGRNQSEFFELLPPKYNLSLIHTNQKHVYT